MLNIKLYKIWNIFKCTQSKILKKLSDKKIELIKVSKLE
jgi:hypothetical protein